MNNYKTKMDANGNQILAVKPANGRGFSIQTGGNLPTTNRDGVGAWTDGEVLEYVRKFGTAGQRAALGILPPVYLNWGHEEKNAALIAAAPDLLNMLQRMVDLVQHVQRMIDETGGGGSPCLLTLEQARAAIRKAKGEG